MKSYIFISIVSCMLVASLGIFHFTRSSSNDEAELFSHGTFVENLISIPPTEEDLYKDWTRPEGPIRVGLQVGHWKNKELPDEFERLREEGGGTSGGGKAEWEVGLQIAELTAELLRTKGIVVDLLPATVPPDYLADVFVAIHADGNENTSVSGYKIAAPRRDMTGNAEELASYIEEEYGKSVALPLDKNITRNMTGYYAFNWRLYEHSMHPMTPAAIVETGFLTNPQDRKIIVRNPEIPAKGIANGIVGYLRSQDFDI